jgi:hypothetical protein
MVLLLLLPSSLLVKLSVNHTVQCVLLQSQLLVAAHPGEQCPAAVS